MAVIALPSDSAGASVKRACIREVCTPEKKVCSGAVREQRRSDKASCADLATKKDRSRCRKAARSGLRTHLKACVAARRECKRCCAGGDPTVCGATAAIDANMVTLPHPDQVEPFPERPVGNAEVETYDVDGRTYECSVQEYEIAAELNEQLTLNPTSDILWPGAIIDGATIHTGGCVPIIADRKPLTISVSLVNIAGAKSKTVQDPKLSTMREAIADILAQEVTGATDARGTFEITDVYSESQLDIALGVTYDSGLTSVKNQFDFSKTESLSRTLVKFLQVYYSIDVDVPEKPSDLFASWVSWGSLETQMSGHVSPAYVSTIAYGRMALFSLESKFSSTQVHEAIEASIKAINTDVDLDVKHKNVLQQTTMKATIVGGSGQQAVQVVNGFEGLKQYMTQGGNYSKDTAAAPLAYKMRHLRDNETCAVVMAQNYVVKTCEELTAGLYRVLNNGGYVARFRVDYDLDGQRKRTSSGDITLGLSKTLSTPAKATNIFVYCEEFWGFGWKEIFRYATARPEEKCWEVWGTTLSPKYKAVACYQD